MTQNDVVRWARIVSLGPARTTDEDWQWAQENAIAYNNRRGLIPALDAERKLLVAKFVDDDCPDKDAPLSPLHI